MTLRRQRAPWDFECPYQHNCPHLEEQSTQWVWGEYQRSYEEHCEHWQVRDNLRDMLDKALRHIKELEKENEQLEASLRALHQRQFKANKRKKQNSENSTDQTTEPEQKKKCGAPKGHLGWSRRKPDHVDKTVIVSAPEECPHCASPNLTSLKGFKDHLQEDIVLRPRTFVTNFKHHQAFCSKCNRAVIQAAEGELLNCQIGPVTKAAAVFLRYGLRIPYRKVRDFFDVFFNMPFVPASAMAFDRTATRKGEPLYEDLKEKLRHTAFVHADETHWREDGINHYVWYAGNDDLAVFHIDRHRSSAVATSILGNNYDGVLNTDGYAAYNAVNAKDRQSCLAHLIRKAKEIKKEILLKRKKFHDQQSIRFCDSISSLLKKACEIRRNTNEKDIKSGLAEARRHRFYSLLNTVCLTQLSDKNAETLRKRLLDPKKEYDRLFTFLKYPDVQPTNNQAEQSLRNMVIFRKVCFGTRSADGSLSHSVIPSLVLTAQRQKQHPLKFLQALFTKPPDFAQKSLFNNMQ